MELAYRTNIKGEELTINDRIMPAKEVAEKVNISRPHIYKMEDNYEFPPRHKMSKARVGWLEADVVEFLRLGPVQFKAVYEEELKRRREQSLPNAA